MDKYIKKIKSKFLFIMFIIAFALVGLTSTAIAKSRENVSIGEAKSIWFLNMPGFNGQSDGDVAIAKGGDDGKGWYANEGIVYQGRSNPKFDHYYYFVKYGNSNSGNIIGELSTQLEKNTTYNIKLWYKNTGNYNTDIYLLKKIPESVKKGSKITEEELKDYAKKIGEITKTSCRLELFKFKF